MSSKTSSGTSDICCSSSPVALWEAWCTRWFFHTRRFRRSAHRAASPASSALFSFCGRARASSRCFRSSSTGRWPRSARSYFCRSGSRCSSSTASCRSPPRHARRRRWASPGGRTSEGFCSGRQWGWACGGGGKLTRDNLTLVKSYTAVVERDAETGLYVGFVPGLLGAHTQAESLDELNRNLREVVAMLLQDGEPSIETEFVGIQLVQVD